MVSFERKASAEADRVESLIDTHLRYLLFVAAYNKIKMEANEENPTLKIDKSSNSATLRINIGNLMWLSLSLTFFSRTEPANEGACLVKPHIFK